MKLDRLLSIVILLVNRGRVQAKELAELFEVSIRTIYRDVDAINQAGIPVITYQGANGGIGLAEGYRLDRNVLTNDDMANIVTALQSISTSSFSTSHQILLDKINGVILRSHMEQFDFQTSQFIVDFSSWGQHGQLEKNLKILKQAIENIHVTSFTYCNAKGEEQRRSVEPYTIVMKNQHWYLYAYCQYRQDFRLFKLLRMKDVIDEEISYERQPVSFDPLPWQQDWIAQENGIRLVLRFNEKGRHLAEEQFGVEELREETNGFYTVTVSFPEDPWLYGFILSFGQDVEVVEPSHIRNIIQGIAKRISDQYGS
ncbi:helix-turn-helix transcriptional regulator [Paenibacillus sp. IHBB 10380]|uniref:helix-turn-helix transcriptional regulator n=1 Tax=Paenibacillus sp. IHBB 10380 TaxID=1566358 RepID=UPI0005CFCE51|nr:YafY family protein [Paenibacillus sp. IHBB 10380]AJS59921.1 transcriptional regulator [Paenibacillus sp. IHBB 10380]